MRRIWQRSLAARFIILLLLALGLSQALAVVISWDERSQALRAASLSEFLGRTASLALLLESTPPNLQHDILDVTSTTYTRFWVSATPPQAPEVWWREARAHLIKPLPRAKELNEDAKADLARLISPLSETLGEVPPWTDLQPQDWPLSRSAHYLAVDGVGLMGLTVRLENGVWLNAAYAKSMRNSLLSPQALWSLGITALALSLIAVLVSRNIARPMQRLAVAAELLGRGEAVPPLPESGPDDIRQTAEAFNRMQSRVQRFIDDRTRMLAAIGHDLRTPLTSLRLRAEFVSDPEIQEKMLATIEEIRSMTEAAIAYAREEATAEETRAVNVTALVESLCDDLAELGMQVSFLGGPKLIYRCRPDGLRRALRNLIENAVRYGERARVGLSHSREGIDILIEDDGPGIPLDAQEQVFMPFYRLEDSRNRDTGGLGLGLSIARSIVRHHGGDIRLSNSHSGLQALIVLPMPR
ncbi:ATP-binding protein [Aquipseudomonas alcaligenes]|uniref:ATP-binding protein n=1 Tax=Aquipseudomonas alcaligenes TaxID=43263 RepID=UPI003748D999